MKLSKRYIIFISLIFLWGYCDVISQEKSVQSYSFTVENKLLNKKIFVALYETFGPSRWKQVASATTIDSLKFHKFTLSQSKVVQQQYSYAFSTEPILLSKKVISQREKDALDAHTITSSKVAINTLSFPSKNPLNLKKITLYNDYPYPLFVARYIPNTTKKLLHFDLASVIFSCNAKASIEIALPTDAEIVLLCAQNSDYLKDTVNLKDATEKQLPKGFVIARGMLENLKKDISKNHYVLSDLLASDKLTVVNDTTRDWTVALYAPQGIHQLQRISDSVLCKSKTETIYDKKLFSPIAYSDYKPSLWVLFEEAQKITPLLSIHHTLHGEKIPRTEKSIRLSRWFSESKKIDNTQENKADEVTDSSSPVVSENEDFAAQNDLNIIEQEQADEQSVDQALTDAQNTLTGSFNMQVSNTTSKDIFIALYKKDKKNYIRREKPIKITKKQPASIGFEENEILVYSVSGCELVGSLTTREYNTLNTETNLKQFDDAELKIKETMFSKNDSFNIMEITIENNSYNDIVVGRYEQQKPGKLTLAGVVQKIAKKDISVSIDIENTSDTDKEDIDNDADAESLNESIVKNSSDSQKTTAPNFAVPYDYHGFVGYQDSYSDNAASQMDSSIDTVFSFENNHLTKIDTSAQKLFDAEKDFKGECITLENDFNERKWFSIYTMHDKNLSSAESIAAGATKKCIPYYDTMKVIIKDNYFDATLFTDDMKPYHQIIVNKPSTYYLQDAKIVSLSATEKEAKALVQEKRIAEREKIKKPTKPRIKKPIKPVIGEKEFYESKIEKITPELPVKIEEQKKYKPELQESRPVIMCTDKQIHINNQSGKDIFIRFYYKGFFSTTKVEKQNISQISNGQDICLDQPASTYLSDRYVIIAFEFIDLKDSYSNKELAQFVKNNKAFNIEKNKDIIIPK